MSIKLQVTVTGSGELSLSTSLKSVAEAEAVLCDKVKIALDHYLMATVVEVKIDAV